MWASQLKFIVFSTFGIFSLVNLVNLLQITPKNKIVTANINTTKKGVIFENNNYSRIKPLHISVEKVDRKHIMNNFMKAQGKT